MDATKWPLDFDALQKGDYISMMTVQEFAGCKPGSDLYNLKRLALAAKIEDAMEARGVVVTIKHESDGGLRILTDLEASQRNSDLARQGIAKIGRSLRRIAGVDPTEFEEVDKRKHDHRVALVASAYTAARKAWGRTPQLTATQGRIEKGIQ